MDIIDQIKKLAGEGVDLVLQKMDSRRVGAEAERRGLFAAWMRNASNSTLADLLRERGGLFSCVGDDELKLEFARRGLWDYSSDVVGAIRGADAAQVDAVRNRTDEALRVRALAWEITELAGKL